MASYDDPRVDRALVPLLLGLTDVGEGSDGQEVAAGQISKICRLLQIDVLYTVLSEGECWVKTGFDGEGALGHVTITRPAGIIRHVFSKKTRMLQKRLTGRGTFHRYQDGWPGRRTASFLAVPLRRRGSIDGVLVLLRGPDHDPFDLEEFEPAELVADAIAIRETTGRTIRRLTLLSRSDEATGLPNERAAWQVLEREVERASRTGEEFSIMRILFTGLDRLPKTREAYGNDAILTRLAKLVAGTIRGGDLLARLSTNELLIVLPETSRKGLTHLVSRIDVSIRSDSEALLRRLQVTPSFAGAAYPEDGVDAPSLLSGLQAIDPAANDEDGAAPDPLEAIGEEKKKAA